MACVLAEAGCRGSPPINTMTMEEVLPGSSDGARRLCQGQPRNAVGVNFESERDCVEVYVLSSLRTAFCMRLGVDAGRCNVQLTKEGLRAGEHLVLFDSWVTTALQL